MLGKTVFLGVGLAVALLVAAETAGAQQGDPRNGKVLWEEVHMCNACHGLMGEGKYASPRASDAESAAEWIAQVRASPGGMPSFSAAQVSDQDIADMNAYMRTVPRQAGYEPWPFPVSPQGDDSRGDVLFSQKRCHACHGDGSELANSFVPSRGQSAEEALLKQVRTPTGLMPKYSETQVTDAEAHQIGRYLASLAPKVEFRLGFKSLAELIPTIVGTPLENEHSAANGDAIQQTTGGLMVWRKADNWTAFTDGTRTWVNGPLGPQQRGNDDRFDWEKVIR